MFPAFLKVSDLHVPTARREKRKAFHGRGDLLSLKKVKTTGIQTVQVYDSPILPNDVLGCIVSSCFEDPDAKSAMIMRSVCRGFKQTVDKSFPYFHERFYQV